MANYGYLTGRKQSKVKRNRQEELQKRDKELYDAIHDENGNLREDWVRIMQFHCYNEWD